MKKIKVGVIGLGFIGKLHLDALFRNPQVSVIGISEKDESILKKVQESFFIEKAYSDWHDLINDAEVEVIHNCTPNFLHDEINEAVIQAGKHIYSEKPLSTTGSKAWKLWQLARENKVANGLNHQYRCNAAIQEMRSRIARGDCGRIFMARGAYLQESMVAGEYTNRMDPRLGPTRALGDIGVHWVDTVSCVLNQPVVSVLADFHIDYPQRKEAATGAIHEIKTEDSAFVLIRFADGTPGQLTVSKVSCGHKNDLTLSIDARNYSMNWNQERCDLLELGFKDKGNETIIIGPQNVSEEVKPFVYAPAGHSMGWCDSLNNSIRLFYQSIIEKTYLNDEQPYATFRSGWLGNSFLDACVESNIQKKWVNLDLKDMKY